MSGWTSLGWVMIVVLLAVIVLAIWLAASTLFAATVSQPRRGRRAAERRRRRSRSVALVVRVAIVQPGLGDRAARRAASASAGRPTSGIAALAVDRRRRLDLDGATSAPTRPESATDAAARRAPAPPERT